MLPTSRLVQFIAIGVVCNSLCSLAAAQVGDQPNWLQAHLRFEAAAELIVTGEYQKAHASFVQAKDELPNPYGAMAGSAADRMFNIFSQPQDADDLFGKRVDAPPVRAIAVGFGKAIEVFVAGAADEKVPPKVKPARRDPFAPDPLAIREEPGPPPAGGDPFGGGDPFDGRPIPRKFVQREAKDASEYLWLARICRDIHAYDAAIVMYRKSLEVQRNEEALYELARCLYGLHANPQQVSEIVDELTNDTHREIVRGYLEPLGNSRRASGMVEHRLANAHAQAGLVRLRELEDLRPLVTTREQRLKLRRAQAIALHQLGDFRARNEAYESIINDHGDDAEVCGDILCSLAQLERRRSGQDSPEYLDYLRRVVEEHPTSRRYGQALTRLGYAYYRQGRLQAAVDMHEKLFQWGEAEAERHLLSGRYYLPDLHQPAMTLSRIYESLEDPRAALKYARLARDKYRYRSFCGTGLEQIHARIHQRVRNLERAVLEMERLQAIPEPAAERTSAPRYNDLLLRDEAIESFPLPQF